MTLGILTQNIGSPFYDSVAQGVIEGLAGSGYTPTVIDRRWEQTKDAASIETLISRKVDGLLIVAAREVKGFEGQ